MESVQDFPKIRLELILLRKQAVQLNFENFKFGPRVVSTHVPKILFVVLTSFSFFVFNDRFVISVYYLKEALNSVVLDQNWTDKR